MVVSFSDIQSGSLHAQVFEPESPTGAGVLMLPSNMGLDSTNRLFCTSLAEAGIAVLAWDPYSTVKAPARREEARELARTLKDSQVQNEQRRWLEHLLGPLSLPRVGVVGFCMGGRMALTLAAAEPRLATCVAYYPSLRYPLLPNEEIDTLAVASEIRCPVQINHGGQDHILTRQTFLELQTRLQSRSAATSIQVYPEAGHGFLDPDHEDEANRAAGRLAWPQTIAFLRASLSPTVGTGRTAFEEN